LIKTYSKNFSILEVCSRIAVQLYKRLNRTSINLRKKNAVKSLIRIQWSLARLKQISWNLFSIIKILSTISLNWQLSRYSNRRILFCRKRRMILFRFLKPWRIIWKPKNLKRLANHSRQVFLKALNKETRVVQGKSWKSCRNWWSNSKKRCYRKLKELKRSINRGNQRRGKRRWKW